MGSYFWLVDRCRPNERNFLYSNARRFIKKFLDSEQPDTVLSVHPMLNHFIQRFIKEEKLGIPCHTFLTDPFPPFWQGWASPWVDKFLVPTHEALQELTAMGVAAWRIEQVPMPVRSQFRPFTTAARQAFCEELQLDYATTILLNGGARGGGPLLSIYQAARRAAPDANILVVCGIDHQIAQPDMRNHAGIIEQDHRPVAELALRLVGPDTGGVAGDAGVEREPDIWLDRIGGSHRAAQPNLLLHIADAKDIVRVLLALQATHNLDRQPTAEAIIPGLGHQQLFVFHHGEWADRHYWIAGTNPERLSLRT